MVDIGNPNNNNNRNNNRNDKIEFLKIKLFIIKFSFVLYVYNSI